LAILGVVGLASITITEISCIIIFDMTTKEKDKEITDSIRDRLQYFPRSAAKAQIVRMTPWGESLPIRNKYAVATDSIEYYLRHRNSQWEMVHNLMVDHNLGAA